MGDDLISVIVPVYNAEKYVRETLDSIVNQTYQKLEILVVDDGSADHSPEICDAFAADDRVRVFHRSNCGLSPSRQFGIDHCNGRYFVTVDADDYVAADYVEKLYLSIRKNNADISVCGVSCFWDGREEISAVVMPECPDERLAVTRELLASGFYQLTCDLILTDSWNKMYRTQFVRDTKVTFELGKIYNGTDLQFNHRLALHCPVYSVCRESLLFHRNHEGSRIQRKDKPFQEGFEIITDSLIRECELAGGLSIREQLSRVYYGFMGMVIKDIHKFSGSFREQHVKFRVFVRRNRRYLNSRRDSLDKIGGFRPIEIHETGRSLPAFVLSHALWLDATFLGYFILVKIKAVR